MAVSIDGEKVEALVEGWNEMSDEDFIELNDIISFKKEWV